MDNKLIIIIVVVVALIGIGATVALVMKNKKDKQAKEPIHKEYDPSIAPMVNNGTPTSSGTFVPSTATPAPVQSSMVQQTPIDVPNVDMSAPISDTFAPQGPTPVVPSVTPMNNSIMPTFEPTQPTPMMNAEPTVAEPVVQPTLTPSLDVPVTPVAQEPVAPQVAEPLVQPAVMPSVVPTLDASTPAPVTEPIQQPIQQPVQEPVQVPAPTPVQTPMFVNVGTVAEPIVDEPEEPKQEVVTPTFVPTPEPVMPTVVEEPKPAVAETIAAPTMENFEIKTPEPEVQEADVRNVTPEPVKRAPMFVLDDMMEDNKKTTQDQSSTSGTSPLYNKNITVDIPDMEEMI